MLDIKFIRENIEAVRQALKNKNHCFDLDNFLRLDAKRRELTKEADELRAAQK